MIAQLQEEKIAKRPAREVMRLERLGSFHQSRLSFMRILLRRMRDEDWSVTQTDWQVNDHGEGHAVYTAKGPSRSYSLVAFAHDLPDHLRSDRVIAEAWDATFTLFDGVPTKDDIKRLSVNVPYQEAGRVSESELCLARANRSSRLWNSTIDALAAGNQPDTEELKAVGYLMRTTAVYGSGKFGAKDRSQLASRSELLPPFQAEMLTVYLIRLFVFDLVDHLAAVKGHGDAAKLDPEIKKSIGIGNSTGLGMAPFLIKHPALFHAWIDAREEAISRVRSLNHASDTDVQIFMDRLHKTVEMLPQWQSSHPFQIEKCDGLRADMAKFISHLNESDALSGRNPWDTIFKWVQDSLSIECQECVASLMLEPYGALVDELAPEMAMDEDEAFPIDGTMTVGLLKHYLTQNYDWVDRYNFQQDDHKARFWYVSEAKLEPRLGERFEDEGAELEQPLAIARDVAELKAGLKGEDDLQLVAEYLLKNPLYRHIVRRVQLSSKYSFAEIQDNLIASEMMPIDMLRCKLSFFGATKFDPRSDRWVRICMYQGAPLPEDLGDHPDSWTY